MRLTDACLSVRKSWKSTTRILIWVWEYFGFVFGIVRNAKWFFCVIILNIDRKYIIYGNEVQDDNANLGCMMYISDGKEVELNNWLDYCVDDETLEKLCCDLI